MARPITWWRLYRGKVWHVGWAGDAAACGTEPGTTAEYVGERAPVNARVCGDCVAMALHLYALAQAAQMGDPRTPERGLIGVPGVPLPEVDDGVIDAEIVECCDCDNPEHGPNSMDAAAEVIWRWSGITPNGSLPDSMIYRAARANAHPDRQGGDRGPWDAVRAAGKLLGLAG